MKNAALLGAAGAGGFLLAQTFVPSVKDVPLANTAIQLAAGALAAIIVAKVVL